MTPCIHDPKGTLPNRPCGPTCNGTIADTQIGGSHYIRMAVQPWDAMASWMSHEEFTGFLRGNVIKYTARAGSKGEAIEDYKKARHYLDKLIEVQS
jgi:hypothetical protein